MIDRLRTTLASFLAYFVMASMITLAGLVSGAFADAAGLAITDATARFSWYGIGVLAGSVLALFALDRLSPARAFQLVSLGVLAASVAIALSASAATLGPLLATTGGFAGVGVAAAAWTISASYAPRLRASMLLVTDLCFSAAGVVLGTAVPWLLASADRWSTAYLVVSAAALVQLVLVLGARFPERSGSDAGASGALPAGTVAAGAALLCYTFAQGSLMLWLPQLATTVYGADGATGGALVGRYWSGMASVGLFVATATGAALDALTRLLFALGLANSGLLKLTLAWASSWVSAPPPRLLSVLLFAATTGTALAPALSARWVDAFGIVAAPQLSAMAAAAMLAGLGLAALRSRTARARLEAPEADPEPDTP